MNLNQEIVMDQTRAMMIVKALADGVNPVTGEVFAADSPYQLVEIVRALYVAVEALKKPRKKRGVGMPGNAGKPWNDEEDLKLLASFDEGLSIGEIAQLHDRTAAGIQARLERHGRLVSGWRTARVLQLPDRRGDRFGD